MSFVRNGLIRLSRAALCVAACFGGVASTAAAPTLPKVVAGQATFSQDGNVFSITNTPGTIINWQSFSVNAGEVTRFIQQSSDSAVLNRVSGQDPSRILGALQSNGKVFLINPNGVVFGQGARVDVNGLVASTLDMSDADFLAGKKNFTAGPTAGKVSNEGTITTPSGGKVFLVAPNVENSGVITAPNGEVVLAAGRSVQLVDSSNPDLSVVVSAPGDQAINLGQVVAQGGRIGIYGALVNQRGVLNANSAVLGRDGKIVLKASKETVLEGGSVTSAGSIDLRANDRINLAAGSLLASPDYIDLTSNQMTLAGDISGVNGLAPVLSFNTFDNTRAILLRGTAPSWALGLDPARLGAFDAYEINIGNSGHAASISIDQGLTMAGNLAIDTGGSININAAVRLTGANSQFIGTLHRPLGSGAMVSNVGSIEAAKKISLLGADQVQVYGAMASGAIDISAGSGGIQLNTGTSLSANDTMTLRSAGMLYQEGGAVVKAPRLLIEGDSVQMLGANQVGTLAGKATRAEAGNLRFRYTGDLKIGTVAGVSGLAAPVELALQGGALTADADIQARAVLVEADAIGGNGRFMASSMLYLESSNGIGSAGSPLRTSATVLNAFNTGSGSTPINIQNDRALVVRDVVQAGGGSISIETTGGLTVAATSVEGQGVRTGSGDISLVTHSPLTIEGRVSTESGNVALLADNNGALTIREGGQVASASGAVRLTGGQVSYAPGSVTGRLEVVQTKPGTQQPDPGRPDPDPAPPQLNVCLANPDTPGCSRVIEVATRTCMSDPDGPGCAQVLPPVDTCRTNPGKLGCTVVMQREEIRQCIATPKAQGCAGVLPPFETCEKSPATYGCAPVIAERDAISQCIATPTAPGCGETLPPLATCRLDAGVYGCAPVIARAEFLACVANPTAAGCAQRLPALPLCKATPGIEGCAQVLQAAFNACLVNKGDPSCAGILPTLSQCESNKAMAGCEAVLPTLQQCVGSPTLQGCSVMLPRLEQCVVNPNLAGCEAVLPKPDFCSTHPTDPRCAVFNPAPAQGGGESKKPVAEAQQTTVNLINTRTPAQEKLPTAVGSGTGDGGAGGSKPSEQPENRSGPAAGTNTGVKNEKPATKMYCN